MKVNISDIENTLAAKKSSLTKFLTLANNHFNIGDFDIYEEINEHMKKLL